MTSLAKSRSRPVVSVDPRMGAFVNDNAPPAFPAHELSGLDGLPRPPAAEAVVHYARLAGIASYPAHPDAAADNATTAPAIDALPGAPMAVPAATRRGTIAASLCSLLCHAAVFAALMTAVVTLPEEPVEDAGDSVSVIMLGNGDADQQASGEESNEPPKPDEIVAEAVKPEVVQPSASETADATPVPPQPTETVPPVQPAEPVPESVQPDPVQPTQAMSQVSPETVISPEPEVLAAQVPAEPTVVQPQATEIQPEEMKPASQSDAAPPAVQPDAVPPEAPTTVAPPLPPETVKPIEKPTLPPKTVQKPKEVVKKPPPPKAAKVKAGSKGENEQDAKKGSSEGTETARSDRNSQAVGNRQGSGSAAVANYPGKVQSRIRRSVRVPSQYRRMTAAMTVLVRLTVDSGGQLSALAIARSSGIAELDNAVLEGVRRAAPFPPLPPEWGKPSWSFTQPLQVTGR